MEELEARLEILEETLKIKMKKAEEGKEEDEKNIKKLFGIC